MAEPISPSKTSKSCGLTAITTRAAPATASAFEIVAFTPSFSRSSSTRSSRRPVATISSGFRQPPLTRPVISASPIVPAPRTATRLSLIVIPVTLGDLFCDVNERLGSEAARDDDRPLAQPGEHVDARQAGPLAVGLEQLRGFPAFDPAAAQTREQLDQAEVADEATLVTAQPLETDHPDRPRADPGFAYQSSGGRVGRDVAQALERERPAQANERARPRAAEAERPQFGGRETSERLRRRRRVQPLQGRHRCPHDPTLDLARPTRRDQLAAERAQQG